MIDIKICLSPLIIQHFLRVTACQFPKAIDDKYKWNNINN